MKAFIFLIIVILIFGILELYFRLRKSKKENIILGNNLKDAFEEIDRLKSDIFFDQFKKQIKSDFNECIGKGKE